MKALLLLTGLLYAQTSLNLRGNMENPAKAARWGSYVSTADANAVVLRAGSCRFLSFNVVSGSTARWLKFYDKASAPTPADTPFLVIKGNASLHLTGATAIPQGGILIENGLALRITANAAESDDTAVAVGDATLKYYFTPEAW